MLLPAIVTREGKIYVALAPDVDIASQGETVQEALSNLEEALELYFEDEDAIRPQINERPIITLVEASP
jgi:predicted RNase H-like HicB family nuclease